MAILGMRASTGECSPKIPALPFVSTGMEMGLSNHLFEAPFKPAETFRICASRWPFVSGSEVGNEGRVYVSRDKANRDVEIDSREVRLIGERRSRFSRFYLSACMIIK